MTKQQDAELRRTFWDTNVVLFVYRKKCTPFEVESEASRYSDRSISATPLDGSVNVLVSHQTANLNNTSKENYKEKVLN